RMARGDAPPGARNQVVRWNRRKAMITLLRREFTVELPRERAWQHLARVEQWPSWAKHIKRVELRPPSELGPGSTGRLRLSNGGQVRWTVTEFNPYRNW